MAESESIRTIPNCTESVDPLSDCLNPSRTWKMTWNVVVNNHGWLEGSGGCVPIADGMEVDQGDDLLVAN